MKRMSASERFDAERKALVIERARLAVQPLKKDIDWTVSGAPEREDLFHRSELHVSQVASAAENGLEGVSEQAISLMTEVARAIPWMNSTPEAFRINDCIEAGWPVNAADPDMGRTLMGLACTIVGPSRLKLVQTLIELGADPHQTVHYKNKNQSDVRASNSPFMVMIKQDDQECLEIMSRAHAGGMLTTGWRSYTESETAPSLAVLEGTPQAMDIVQKLFERDILPAFDQFPVNMMWLTRDENGRALFMHACRKPDNQAWLLEQLRLGMAAHLEDRSNDGKTAVWHACEWGDSRAVMALIGRGASVDIKDAYGRHMEQRLAEDIKDIGSLSGNEGRKASLSIVSAALAVERAAKAIDAVMSEAVNQGVRP